MILSYASQNAQFHLGIITAHQIVIACARSKNAANLLALLGASGNVLQIGVRAGKSARNGNSLLEVGVNAIGFGVYKGL